MSALSIAIAKLRSVAGVTALVPAARIFPIEAPQELAPPFIIINLTSERDEQLLNSAGGYFDSRISVECVGATGTSANDIGEAVKKALQNVIKQDIVSLGASPVTYLGVDIMKADTDLTDRADDRSLSRRIIDFYVRWHGAL